MDFNAIPWTTDELINYACLIAATLMVASFPVVYSVKAQWRDHLARVVILATSATALAFVVTAVLIALYHADVALDEQVTNWVVRALYLSIGVGKVMLLWTLLSERKHAART